MRQQTCITKDTFALSKGLKKLGRESENRQHNTEKSITAASGLVGGI